MDAPQSVQPPSPDESQLYYRLIEEIDSPEGRLENQLNKVMGGQDYKDYVARFLGCEVISVYITPKNAMRKEQDKQREIKFLTEVRPNSPDYPMYIIPKGKEKRPYIDVQAVDETIRKERRASQQKILIEVAKEKTSASLCAQYLSSELSPGFLLLHFGEILAYCYLYHIVKEKSGNSDQSIIALAAWNKLTNAHKHRWQGNMQDDDQVAAELISALKQWYTLKKEDSNYARPFLHALKIDAVYQLTPKLKELLETAENPQNRITFLSYWAEYLYNSLKSVAEDHDLNKAFWEKTLVNPNIELLFMTRGLFVTIIHSPITKTGENINEEPDTVSEAHAICTVFDTTLLENSQRRGNLKGLLKTMSYDEIASYDYEKLNKSKEELESRREQLELRQQEHQRLQKNHQQIQQLLINVSSPGDNWHELLQIAAKTCLQVSQAVHVLVSLKNIGSYTLVTNDFKDSNGIYFSGWFHDKSFITETSNKVLLYPPGKTTIDICEKSKKELQEALEKATNTKFDTNLEHADVAIIDKDHDRQIGVITIFTKEKGVALDSIKGSLEQIATAISIGFKLPFRSMTNKGLMARVLSWTGEFIRRTFLKGTLKQSGPQLGRQYLADMLIATMLEFIQLIFFFIGASFLWAIITLLPIPVPFLNKSITDILKHVEATVMAFSICLSATGIFFLLKPELSVSQPRWMKSFAKPGTLEQTLIKLAAMVLTIDVLSVVLSLQETLQSSTTFLWILVKPVLFHLVAYLIILLGLAFVSHFLLNEKETPKNRKKDNHSEENDKTDTQPKDMQPIKNEVHHKLSSSGVIRH